MDVGLRLLVAIAGAIIIALLVVWLVAFLVGRALTPG
jgi:hypothetical protein